MNWDVLTQEIVIVTAPLAVVLGGGLIVGALALGLLTPIFRFLR